MLLRPGPVLHLVVCVRAEESGSQRWCRPDHAVCSPGPSWTRWSTGRASWPWSTWSCSAPASPGTTPSTKPPAPWRSPSGTRCRSVAGAGSLPGSCAPGRAGGTRAQGLGSGLAAFGPQEFPMLLFLALRAQPPQGM